MYQKVPLYDYSGCNGSKSGKTGHFGPNLDLWAPNKARKSPKGYARGPKITQNPHKLVLPENVSISAFYKVILGEMDPKKAKLVILAQIGTFGPLIRPVNHHRAMLEGPKSPKSPHKLVLPENVSIKAFYMVILGEIDPKVAKLVILAQIGTFGPLIRPVIHQRVML